MLFRKFRKCEFKSGGQVDGKKGTRQCLKQKGVAREGKHMDCARLSVLRRSARTNKES